MMFFCYTIRYMLVPETKSVLLDFTALTQQPALANFVVTFVFAICFLYKQCFLGGHCFKCRLLNSSALKCLKTNLPFHSI